MGYTGRLEEKRKASKLRKKGYSYGEILKKIKVAKSTLSIWCRDIVLTDKQIDALCKRAEDGRFRSRHILGEKRKTERQERIKNLKEQGKREVGELNKRDRFIAGIGLYMGDGSKSPQQLSFANSDPEIIKFMMGWFREFCKIPEEKFHGKLWIHDDQNVKKAKKFWSEITDISLKQFHKPYIAKNKPNSNKIRKKRHEYGIFGIGGAKAETQRKILGWMSGILENYMIK
jgi:hypothetical protein